MSHFGTIGNTVTVNSAVGTLDEHGNFLWDKCPSCGGPLVLTEEIVFYGEGKQHAVKHQKCMDPKTSGCLG
jgi:hypothetical protein